MYISDGLALRGMADPGVTVVVCTGRWCSDNLSQYFISQILINRAYCKELGDSVLFE